MNPELTLKQQKFANAYEGNAEEAATIAGYSNPSQQGSRLLKHVGICRSIEKRTQARYGKEDKQRVMDIEARREWLTTTINESDISKQDAMKALDILNKMDALYIQKHEVRTNFQGMSDEEVEQAVIKTLEGRGYIVTKRGV